MHDWMHHKITAVFESLKPSERKVGKGDLFSNGAVLLWGES